MSRCLLDFEIPKQETPYVIMVGGRGWENDNHWQVTYQYKKKGYPFYWEQLIRSVPLRLTNLKFGRKS